MISTQAEEPVNHITLCIPTLRRFDTLKTLLRSAENSSRPPDAIVIMDNSAGKLNIDDWGLTIKPTVIVPPYNLGVAASWNFFLTQLDDYVVICNDDIELHPLALEKLLQAANANPLEYLFSTQPEEFFSFYLMKRRLLMLVGLFDEKLWPAYYEDNDIKRRAELIGIDLFTIKGYDSTHVGSATLKAATPEQQEQHHRAFRRNQMYYIEKWGGLPGSEVFTTPFNRRK